MTKIVLAAVMLLASASSLAQGTSATSKPAASQPAAPSGKADEGGSTMPSLIQKLPDYSGSLAERQYLTGDWGGARTEMAEQGILFDFGITQWIQGNAYGGKDTNNAFRYSGSADLTLKFDTARMGLWPGGLITLHGETQIGQSINPKSGAILTPNFQALLPVPGESGETTLSEFFLVQALSEKFVLMAGKVDLTAAADQTAFSGNQRTQFSNTAFKANPVLFNAGPYTAMVAGATWIPTKWLTITTSVVDNDPDGAANRTGFNTAFHGRRWFSVAQEYDFTLKAFEQTGHQRFGWFWTSRDFREFGQDSRLPLPFNLRGRGILPGGRMLPRWLRLLRLGDTVYRLNNPDTRPDDWGFYYNFDQYVSTEADDPEQGWGVFGRFGYSTGEANIFEQFYSIGLGGKGTIPNRDRDTWGIGYYMANISDYLSISSLHSEQGVELFYNIEVTPWLHITPDLQVIVDPGGGYGDRDPSIVYGIRAQMSF